MMKEENMRNSNERPEFSSYYTSKSIADDYDRIHSNTLKKVVVRELEKRFFTTLYGARIEGKLILEIGSGTGELTKHLATCNTVEGIDISPAMIAIAQKKIPSVRFREISMFELEPLTETYDLVIASRVFLHLPPFELQKMLQICASKVRSGGHLLFDLQRPSLWRLALSRKQTEKVENPNYVRAAIEELFLGDSSWTLENYIAFDHWPILLPIAGLPSEKFSGLAQMFNRLETSFQSWELGASKWGIVCRRR